MKLLKNLAKGTWKIAQLVGAYLKCTKLKSVIVHACNSSHQKVKSEDLEFKVILGYISLRAAWDTTDNSNIVDMHRWCS